MTISVETQFFAVALLIISAALISCLETSITAASRPMIHRLKNEGNKRAARLEALLINREQVVSVMLLMNNCINIIASALTTKLLLEIFGEIGMVYATFFLTIIIIIFGEILPKTAAIQAPEKFALFFSSTIEILYKTFAPVVAVVQKLVFVVINFFNKPRKIEKNTHSDLDEIRDTVNLKAKEGSIFQFDKDLIDGVLDLSDTAIGEIMVHRKDIKSVNCDLPVAEIIKKAIDSGFSRIPLWKKEQENIIGILNVRKMLKILHFYRGNIDKFDLSPAISLPLFVPNSNTLRSQLFTFRKLKKRMALVIDEYGSLLGLVCLEDILEEIVGEINEQDDKQQISMIRTKSGIFKIAANALIRDINKKFDLEIAESEEAYNLSAYIINHLGRIPDEKEQFKIGNFAFEVLRKKNNELLLIKLRRVVYN